MRTIKYGGRILPGDFIAVSNGNHIDFGWYAGNGSGTLQYYPMRGPVRCYADYESWSRYSDEEKRKNKWASKRFEKGFTVKCLWKSYINSVYATRVMKITNIEDIFTEQEEREMYEKSKKVLTDLNFIKH
jgi:hypothetical protein